ncbi:MAG: hypothetical protein MHM6MM_005938 [Cercozoa sp. M6MM]
MTGVAHVVAAHITERAQVAVFAADPVALHFVHRVLKRVPVLFNWCAGNVRQQHASAPWTFIPVNLHRYIADRDNFGRQTMQTTR